MNLGATEPLMSGWSWNRQITSNAVAPLVYSPFIGTSGYSSEDSSIARSMKVLGPNTDIYLFYAMIMQHLLVSPTRARFIWCSSSSSCPQLRSPPFQLANTTSTTGSIKLCPSLSFLIYRFIYLCSNVAWFLSLSWPTLGWDGDGVSFCVFWSFLGGGLLICWSVDGLMEVHVVWGCVCVWLLGERGGFSIMGLKKTKKKYPSQNLSSYQLFNLPSPSTNWRKKREEERKNLAFSVPTSSVPAQIRSFCCILSIQLSSLCGASSFVC